MTKEQRELIKDLYAEVVKEEQENSRVKSSDVQMRQKIQLDEYTWSAFHREANGDTYFLLDKDYSIEGEKFGDDNNYNSSNHREVSMNCDPSQKALKLLGKDAFVPLEIDLFSHDGLRDYGVCKGDLFGILNYDTYRNNREYVDYSYMSLSTPDSTPSGSGSSCVQYVYSGGDVDCGDCGWIGRGVRPFFILKSSIFVSLSTK